VSTPPDELLRGAFEQAAIAMAIVALDGSIVRCNRAMTELVGWSESELRGRALLSVIFDADRASVEADVARMKAGEIRRDRVEVRCTHATESPCWALLTCSFVSEAHGSYFVAQMEDISERKRAEERLERYKLLAERARDMILFIGLDGRIVEANDAAVRAYGYTRDELLQRSIYDLRADETQREIAPQMQTANASGILFETVHRRKDGTTFPVQVSSQGASGAGARLLLSIIRDVTDRKRLQDQLMHADRLVALGTLTASIVHEINNPLGYLINNLDLALRGLTKGVATPEDLAGFVHDAREGAERMRRIVQSTRSLLRSDEQPWQRIDVRDVLEATIQMTSLEIRERARLVREYADVPLVAAKESQLGQVFLNLLVNAIQALPSHDADHNEIKLVARAEGNAVVVEVHDTGSGMAPGVLDRIFDPFFTTKPAGVGTGLGLSISQSLVTGMGGTISVESHVGRGSTFRVVLPAASEQLLTPVPITTPKDSELRVGRGSSLRRGRVLVIDDQPALCSTVRHVMALDHEVVTVDSAEAAIDLFGRDHDFDVIFCDADLGGLGAKRLHDEVRTRWPELADRFVFLGEVPPEVGETARIEKPLEIGDLQRVVEERLGRRR
jgi:PAS domain S-box-containing protein